MPTTSSAQFKQSAIIHTLRQCRMFQGLGDDALAAVAETCVLKACAKGTTLFRENEEADGFFVVQSGSIGIVRTTNEGREQVLCVFHAGESFAEVVLTGLNTYPASAVAFEATQVVLVKKAEFRALIFRQPELALRMLGSMSFHLKHFVQLLEDLKFKQIESRLAHWLLRQVPDGRGGSENGIVELGSSKKLLASQLGVTSETLSRTLARFRDEGLITVSGRKITLLNRAGLRAYEESATGGEPPCMDDHSTR
ncbi:MAG: Crp/Fnr family transcriptional regulator [Verrucomicrobiota bacterium]|nr:Crp/Fnr family transcriptional regulator [Verrucomicrobiota bacterium]